MTDKLVVFMANDHTTQLIKEIIKENVKHHKFTTDSITRIVKLAMLDSDKAVITKYNNWGNFHQIYNKNYPKESAVKKYT